MRRRDPGLELLLGEVAGDPEPVAQLQLGRLLDREVVDEAATRHRATGVDHDDIVGQVRHGLDRVAMALAAVDEAEQRDEAPVGKAESLARLGGIERQRPTFDEVGHDAEALERHDAAQPLDLDLRMDDEPVRDPAEQAQAPDVRLEPALPDAAAAEDVVQGDDERAAVGAAEAQQARERASMRAPAAAVPLQQDDLGVVEFAADRASRSACSSIRPASAWRTVRPSRVAASSAISCP